MTSSAHPELTIAGDASGDLLPADVEALFPADPNLMVSPEGDIRGLEEAKAAAHARHAALTGKIPVGHGR